MVAAAAVHRVLVNQVALVVVDRMRQRHVLVALQMVLITLEGMLAGVEPQNNMVLAAAAQVVQGKTLRQQLVQVPVALD